MRNTSTSLSLPRTGILQGHVFYTTETDNRERSCYAQGGIYVAGIVDI